MNQSDRLAHQVSSQIRIRGRSYFRQGRVVIVHQGPTSVGAIVSGTRDYEVLLHRNGYSLEVQCTCPYFQRNLDTCKHVWATVLYAEATGLTLARDARVINPSEELLEDEAPLDDDWEDEEDWGAEEDYDYGDDFFTTARDFVATHGRGPGGRRSEPEHDWAWHLSQMKQAMQAHGAGSRLGGAGRQIVYVVDVVETLSSNLGLVVEVGYRERKMDGEWGVPKPESIHLRELARLSDTADREILALLACTRDAGSGAYAWATPQSSSTRYALSDYAPRVLIPMMCRTGRCFLRTSSGNKQLSPLQWDDGPEWDFVLKARQDESAEEYELEGALCRDGQEVSLAEPVVLIQGGTVFFSDTAAAFNDHDAFELVLAFRSKDKLSVPVEEGDLFLNALASLPSRPTLALPEELAYEEVAVEPEFTLKVELDSMGWGRALKGELSFRYGDVVVSAGEPGHGVYDAEHRRLMLRDADAERRAAERLHDLGFRERSGYRETRLELSMRHLSRVVLALTAEGWRVEADGKLYRQAGSISVSVASGIDWFELHGDVQFGDQVATLPELLKALKKGEGTVLLGDGSIGILPEDWLKQYGMLANLGTSGKDHIRFKRAQVGLLDALLASQPAVNVDDVFLRARDELRAFDGIEASDPPGGFVGTLRGYQREGLGWLYFLQRFGFGGCLADDMGLGKTIQVLALLESRRELRAQAAASDGAPAPGPSLVVVPRSLVFNWRQEAERFTPSLRVLEHTGTDRDRSGASFADYDAILTTYGTLRRDIPELKDVRFDYCILDESQAIKNANTASAKAARLVQADHRLALSGTPIENHLGELWSLFEFLNPGMLGKAAAFGLTGSKLLNPNAETRALLSKALRPFILRRTKDQVATELPAKLEQTLYCELEPKQRKLYNELRDHYRQSLLAKVQETGLKRVKIQVLEALLRLRQAAIHPGLVDKSRTAETSAKLDVLLPQLMEVSEEGHKALVFSQFTSMLAIVRDRLDGEGIPYEYLDGRTRKREERVAAFQNDPECKLFLISLKAGGLGLNLTAAEYVFLLDPWWNPAVEAQAIDRTHRIGQTRQVFAYRLIARDTVEEKVLQLQQAKRDLADAILSADRSLIRDLRKEDLELLLS